MNTEAIRGILNYSAVEIKRSPELFVLFRKIYDAEYKNTVPFCGGCPTGFETAYDYLSSQFNRYNKNMLQMKNEGQNDNQFVIKKGGYIQTVNPSMQYHNGNITDEIAIELLGISENYIAAFEKYPANWKELIKKKPAAKVEEKKESPKVESKVPNSNKGK